MSWLSLQPYKEAVYCCQSHWKNIFLRGRNNRFTVLEVRRAAIKGAIAERGILEIIIEPIDRLISAFYR